MIAYSVMLTSLTWYAYGCRIQNCIFWTLRRRYKMLIKVLPGAPVTILSPLPQRHPLLALRQLHPLPPLRQLHIPFPCQFLLFLSQRTISDAHLILNSIFFLKIRVSVINVLLCNVVLVSVSSLLVPINHSLTMHATDNDGSERNPTCLVSVPTWVLLLSFTH